VTAIGITRPRSRYKRPWLYPKQKAFLYTPKRISITEASTKSGKTAGCMVWLFEKALEGKDGQNFWWIAPTLGVAAIAFNRMKRAIPRSLYKANDTNRTITLAHGPIISFKGADNPDSLFGEDVYAAVIDEATRCKEEAWHAIRTTLTATRGPIRIIGNVKGRKNWAYRLARRAEAGHPNMAYFKLTAWDAVKAGVLDRDEILAAQDELPDVVFRELYLAEPSDDGGNPFGFAQIKKIIQPKGFVPGPPLGLGWDLAKSVDWTVGLPYDKGGNITTAEHRWQGPWELTIAKIVAVTGGRPALVDSTGVGDPVLEALQKDGGQNFTGYHMTRASKQKLMEGLAVAIHKQTCSVPDGVVVRELEAFEYEYTRTGVRYTAPEGFHDDTVVALALAVELMNRPLPPSRVLPSSYSYASN
jgi:hypothetical protein